MPKHYQIDDFDLRTAFLEYSFSSASVRASTKRRRRFGSAIEVIVGWCVIDHEKGESLGGLRDGYATKRGRKRVHVIRCQVLWKWKRNWKWSLAASAYVKSGYKKATTCAFCSEK